MTRTPRSETGEPTPDASRLDRRGFLRSGAGVALGAIGVAGLGGTASAHFPERLEVEIRPNSPRSIVPPNGNGVVRVGVYAGDLFHPSSHDGQYRFGAPDVVASGGGARPRDAGTHTDLDGDGQEDLLLQFSLQEAGFDGTESHARIEWAPRSGFGHGLSGTAEVEFPGGSRNSPGGDEPWRTQQRR